MSRTVIYDAEDKPGFIVRGAGHDLVHQAIQGSHTILRLTAAKDSGLMDIEGSQVSPGTAAPVFMFDARLARLASRSGMPTGSCWEAGLLIGRNHKLVVFQRLAVPKALLEIQEAARLAGKVGVAGEDPGSMWPGTDGVFVQPSPEGAAADLGDQTRLRDGWG
jgi:hypothetical protein